MHDGLVLECAQSRVILHSPRRRLICHTVPQSGLGKARLGEGDLFVQVIERRVAETQLVPV